MKQFYQIHELAKLFDLCPDTLRYYEEKGLLHPVRGENRYRMYGIQDVCTLNIIRSLRELGIPTRSIRAYLERRSVGETLTLLDREEELLRRRMAELEAALKEAQNRRSRLEQYRNAAAGRVELVQEAERPYVFLEKDIILEKEIDFLLKKLEQRHQDYLKVIGSQCMGAAVDPTTGWRNTTVHFWPERRRLAAARPARRWSSTGWTPTIPIWRRSTSPNCRCGWSRHRPMPSRLGRARNLRDQCPESSGIKQCT